ncbi:MAG: hypothetical protein WCK89_08375 [bacterium]
METQCQKEREPELELIIVDGEPCYAFKWSDKTSAWRREVNYAIRRPHDDAVTFLLIDCAPRVPEGSRLKSLTFQAGEAKSKREGFRPARTEWSNGDVDIGSEARICLTDTMQAYREVPTILKKMILQYEDGKRELGDAITRVASAGDATPNRDGAIADMLASIEKNLSELAVVPEILDGNKRKIRDQEERLALLKQVITSSVRTSLEKAEQGIVRRKNDLCLCNLNDEELLLFLFLIGYQWKKEQKKVFSKRDVCWVLGLGDPPHPETVSRKQLDLESAHPAIKLLIGSFRAMNAKGEKRDKRRDISYDGMNNAERRRLNLDDAEDS